MQVQLNKWGNSLAVRIPASIVAEAKLGEGSNLEMKVDSSGVIALTPIPATLTLSDLMDGVTPENLHHETDTGLAVGHETW